MTTDDRTTHDMRGASPADHPGITHYEIRVKGHLGPRWSEWFDGLSVAKADDGTTVIRGPVVDQAALHGLLQRLRDIGLPLVSLTPFPPEPPSAPPAAQPERKLP